MNNNGEKNQSSDNGMLNILYVFIVTGLIDFSCKTVVPFVINQCKEYYKNKNQCWSLEHGITPQCVNSICEKYEIPHYCLDVHKSIIIKNLSKKSQSVNILLC